MAPKVWLDENKGVMANPKVSALLINIKQLIADCRGTLDDLELHRARCYAQDAGETNHQNDFNHGPDDGTGLRYVAYDQVAKARNDIFNAKILLRSALSSTSPYGIDHGGGGGGDLKVKAVARPRVSAEQRTSPRQAAGGAKPRSGKR
jgi:hypothetical protein